MEEADRVRNAAKSPGLDSPIADTSTANTLHLKDLEEIW